MIWMTSVIFYDITDKLKIRPHEWRSSILFLTYGSSMHAPFKALYLSKQYFVPCHVFWSISQQNLPMEFLIISFKLSKVSGSGKYKLYSWYRTTERINRVRSGESSRKKMNPLDQSNDETTTCSGILWPYESEAVYHLVGTQYWMCSNLTAKILMKAWIFMYSLIYFFVHEGYKFTDITAE